MRAAGHAIELVGEGDLDDLLPLLRAYCAHYTAAPADSALLALSRALIADPEREGLQLIARRPDGHVNGFATVFWLWSTVSAVRIGLMNDLFMAPAARGIGLADGLIEACRRRCLKRGAEILTWQTAPDNLRAQAVYARTRARRSTWIEYSLRV